MKSFSQFPFRRFAVTLCLIGLLAGCSRGTAALTPAASATPAVPTATPLPPTATPLPAALVVNQDSISLIEFDAELKRFQESGEAAQALSPEDQRTRVLDDLTDQLLLAQAASEGGFGVDDATLKARVEALTAQLGGQQALLDWQQRNHYTPDSFNQALRRSLLAAHQRDQIMAETPKTAEQVHARQILVLDEGLARSIVDNLKAGADFATLAFQYDAQTGGDLGWFPRGYLIRPEVEKAAFELHPNQVSDIITTDYGYHIVQVIERDA